MKRSARPAKKRGNKVISGFRLAKLQSAYDQDADLHKHFLLALESEFRKILADSSIALAVPIQSRVKQWDSIKEKLARRDVRVREIRELSDLAGMRLILLFQRDVKPLITAIHKNLDVLEEYDTQSRLAEDQFGYSSYHMSLAMPQGWLKVPTMSEFRGLRAEIQIRTVAQHMWAASSHYLQYKRELSVPVSIRRSLYRASALLETLDLEMERVLQERDAYRETIGASEAAGELADLEDSALNVDFLNAVLKEEWPADNRGAGDSEELLGELITLGISTPRQLRSIIVKHKEATLEYDKSYAAKAAAKPELWGEHTDMERVARGAYFTYSGLTRDVLDREFGEAYCMQLKDGESEEDREL